MNEITIGGRQVKVPPGYVQAEINYTKTELDAFDNAVAQNLNKSIIQQCREAVLEKRIKFNELWKHGLITLPEPEPTNEPTSFWNKVLNYLYE